MNAAPNLHSSAKRGARGRRSVEPRSGEAAPAGKTRLCVGCQKAVEQARVRRANSRLQGVPTTDPLVRLVAGPEGAITVDAGDGAFGRGLYVHASAACVAAAASKGLSRSLKRAVTLDDEKVMASALATAIRDAYGRRAVGLFGAAVRARAIQVGSDAVTIAARAGDAALVVVAVDAAQAADLTEVRRAVAEGRAIAWGTKLSLSELVHGAAREAGVGVLCVTDTRLSGAIRESLNVVFGLAPPAELGPAARIVEWNE